jgi:hypothetical protein
MKIPLLISGDVEFFHEIMDFYKLKKRRIRKALRIKSDDEITDFCSDFRQMTSWRDDRVIKHEYVCKLAVIISNILGECLPDHLHAQMILGNPNDYCKEYVAYVGGLKPKKFFGFVNPNPNNYRRHCLSVNGMLSKLVSK